MEPTISIGMCQMEYMLNELLPIAWEIKDLSQSYDLASIGTFNVMHYMEKFTETKKTLEV